MKIVLKFLLMCTFSYAMEKDPIVESAKKFNYIMNQYNNPDVVSKYTEDSKNKLKKALKNTHEASVKVDALIYAIEYAKEIKYNCNELKKIISKNKINHIIWLGRTPTPLAIAYNAEEDSIPNTQLAYSGHPDVGLNNRERKNSDALRSNDLFNFVNIKRLKIYYDYLKGKKLNEISGQNIAIVDVMGTGYGLNAFIRLLKEFYCYQNLKEPTLSFVSLKKLSGGKEIGIKDQGEEVGGIAYNQLHFTLKKNNLEEMSLPYHELNFSQKFLNFADRDEVAYCTGGVPFYPAFLWRQDENPEKRGPYYEWYRKTLTAILANSHDINEMRSIVISNMEDIEKYKGIVLGKGYEEMKSMNPISVCLAYFELAYNLKPEEFYKLLPQNK